MTERLVFTGEDPDGIRVRVVWQPDEPETVYVFTLAGDRARWSRPVECTKEEP